jgi:hypothetical protein
MFFGGDLVGRWEVIALLFLTVLSTTTFVFGGQELSWFSEIVLTWSTGLWKTKMFCSYPFGKSVTWCGVVWMLCCRLCG